ncbi:hypothetical protein KEM52_004928 [Ascosphaera acerosa]|nr:hypothetical protein KEM52_004928 [Ascosphaera acerosa]
MQWYHFAIPAAIVGILAAVVCHDITGWKVFSIVSGGSTVKLTPEVFVTLQQPLPGQDAACTGPGTSTARDTMLMLISFGIWVDLTLCLAVGAWLGHRALRVYEGQLAAREQADATGVTAEAPAEKDDQAPGAALQSTPDAPMI